ncbi:nucleoid-associated protein [Dyella flagellata]|uniref:nucleoid-associated protein n=1 Tax=Dyella flagellata TaxID=1867833 RepID=UPI0024E171EA|nr:nucleoid-associated protein [Dyella flagellata]
MAKESQLSTSELSSLRVRRLIFHVYDPRLPEEKLQCLDAEVTLDGTTTAVFFEERLRAASQGTQFVFAGEHQPVRGLCERLTTAAGEYVELSKEIADAFSKHHRGRQMAAGVIIVALATVETGGRMLPLVFILKLDHKPAMTYSLAQDEEGDTTAQIQRIVNALVEDKAAVQRSALIDISDQYAWDVLASERNEGAAPELRHFFRAFLSVVPREDASVLTRKAVTAVSAWAKEVARTELPPDESWRRYQERAAQYMKDHAEFDTDDFIKAVVRDEDRERKTRASASLRERLRDQGIAGQEFPTKPASLPNKLKRTQLVTEEGVRIIYEGDQGAGRIEVQDDPEHGNQAKRIVIRTSRITEKDGG